MPTAVESRAALQVVTAAAVSTAIAALQEMEGPADQQRAFLLDAAPEVIAYYSIGAAALAADFYDDERERASPPKLYVAEPIIVDRTVKIRRGIAWASDPLFNDDPGEAASRLSEVVQSESARPYRDTILTNRDRDPAAVGWRRIAAGGCKFCRLLADKGAVYKEATARFAAHDNCHCTAQPVFSTNDVGEEASALQYMASQRRRTPAQKAALREYLNDNYSDFSG